MSGAPHSINPCGNPASTTQGTMPKVKVMLHTMMSSEDSHLGRGCTACVSPNRSEAHPCIPWDALLFLFLLLQFHLSFQTSDTFSILVNLLLGSATVLTVRTVRIFSAWQAASISSLIFHLLQEHLDGANDL